jgi:hypothetical protein
VFSTLTQPPRSVDLPGSPTGRYSADAVGTLITPGRSRSVICAAQLTDRLRPGVISVPTASAEYRPAGEPGRSTDLGGCVNVLNTKKPITTKSHGIRPNGTLIEIELWTGVDTWKPQEPLSEYVA